MPRPKSRRCVSSEPRVRYFKPAGIRLVDLEESTMAVDEFEAMRLCDSEGLPQEKAAKKMGISQPTMHRLLSSARGKVADSLVKGKALRIEGGDYCLGSASKGCCGRKGKRKCIGNEKDNL